MHDEPQAVTEPIDHTTIRKVYSGKPGCGCGCNGTYWKDSRNIRRIVGVLNQRLTERREQNGVYFIEDDKRYYWAYTY